jgi:hypothetical protein
LKIQNLLDLSHCGIYDIAGKIIVHSKDIGSNLKYEFPHKMAIDGIYCTKYSGLTKQWEKRLL